jgi:hypothetical protein
VAHHGAGLLARLERSVYGLPPGPASQWSGSTSWVSVRFLVSGRSYRSVVDQPRKPPPGGSLRGGVSRPRVEPRHPAPTSLGLGPAALSARRFERTKKVLDLREVGEKEGKKRVAPVQTTRACRPRNPLRPVLSRLVTRPLTPPPALGVLRCCGAGASTRLCPAPRNKRSRSSSVMPITTVASKIQSSSQSARMRLSATNASKDVPSDTIATPPPTAPRIFPRAPGDGAPRASARGARGRVRPPAPGRGSLPPFPRRTALGRS